jgi:hypothetical protein
MLSLPLWCSSTFGRNNPRRIYVVRDLAVVDVLFLPALARLRSARVPLALSVLLRAVPFDGPALLGPRAPEAIQRLAIDTCSSYRVLVPSGDQAGDLPVANRLWLIVLVA